MTAGASVADPDAKAIYEDAAKGKGVPAFSLMVGDFFHAPFVDDVIMDTFAGHIGDDIVIRAHDDFAVKDVKVAITNANGQAIESGAATETPPESGRWVYKATAAIPVGTAFKIVVTAEDLPGHKGVKEVSKP